MAHRLDFFPDGSTKEGQELIQAYRNVFSSTQGPAVLWHMLYELGAFDESPEPTPEDMALRSYGARLMKIIGGGEVSKATTEQLIQRLISQPLPNITQEDL